MKIMYDGTELNRAGRIGYGNTIGGSVTLTTTTAVDAIQATLTHVERTPSHISEIRWCPNEADMTFIDPSSTINVQDRERRSALTATVVNHTPNAPLTVELTAVYEYKPVLGQGVVTQNRTLNTSSSTISQVISAINRMAGDPWVAAGARAGMNYVFGSSIGYNMDRSRQQTITY